MSGRGHHRESSARVGDEIAHDPQARSGRPPVVGTARFRGADADAVIDEPPEQRATPRERTETVTDPACACRSTLRSPSRHARYSSSSTSKPKPAGSSTIQSDVHAPPTRAWRSDRRSPGRAPRSPGSADRCPRSPTAACAPPRAPPSRSRAMHAAGQAARRPRLRRRAASTAPRGPAPGRRADPRRSVGAPVRTPPPRAATTAPALASPVATAGRATTPAGS